VAHTVQHHLNATWWQVLNHPTQLRYQTIFTSLDQNCKSPQKPYFHFRWQCTGDCVTEVCTAVQEYFAEGINRLLHQWDSCLNACKHPQTGFSCAGLINKQCSLILQDSTHKKNMNSMKSIAVATSIVQVLQCRAQNTRLGSDCNALKLQAMSPCSVAMHPAYDMLAHVEQGTYGSRMHGKVTFKLLDC
jgi:hypothetical protein